MSKAVLISIRLNWVEKICSGEKTIEIRRTRPKIETPFNAYIYCTKPNIHGELIMCKSQENSKLFGYGSVVGINKGFRKDEDELVLGKVIGEFICDKVDKIVLSAIGYMINNDIAYTNKVARESCLYFDDLKKYLGNKVGYAWHITDLKIYDESRELSEFRKVCLNGKCSDCIYEECKLTRPPQSWQYVEELK